MFRGAAHQSCNLQYQHSRTIPVVMHSLSSYDAHFLIRKLACSKKIPGEIAIIPHNSENYISIIKTVRVHGKIKKFANEIRFKFTDSLRFMLASLDYLASIVPNDKKHILKSECIKSGYDVEMFSLLTRKGIFPYEYVDNYAKLNETLTICCLDILLYVLLTIDCFLKIYIPVFFIVLQFENTLSHCLCSSYD